MSRLSTKQRKARRARQFFYWDWRAAYLQSLAPPVDWAVLVADIRYLEYNIYLEAANRLSFAALGLPLEFLPR